VIAIVVIAPSVVPPAFSHAKHTTPVPMITVKKFHKLRTETRLPQKEGPFSRSKRVPGLFFKG
jgi:hypothetical protein